MNNVLLLLLKLQTRYANALLNAKPAPVRFTANTFHAAAKWYAKTSRGQFLFTCGALDEISFLYHNKPLIIDSAVEVVHLCKV